MAERERGVGGLFLLDLRWEGKASARAGGRTYMRVHFWGITIMIIVGGAAGRNRRAFWEGVREIDWRACVPPVPLHPPAAARPSWAPLDEPMDGAGGGCAPGWLLSVGGDPRQRGAMDNTKLGRRREKGFRAEPERHV